MASTISSQPNQSSASLLLLRKGIDGWARNRAQRTTYELSGEDRQELFECFCALAEDGVGGVAHELTWKELTKAADTVLGVSTYNVSSIKDAITAMDLNHNGTVSWPEWRSYMVNNWDASKTADDVMKQDHHEDMIMLTLMNGTTVRLVDVVKHYRRKVILERLMNGDNETFGKIDWDADEPGSNKALTRLGGMSLHRMASVRAVPGVVPQDDDDDGGESPRYHKAPSKTASRRASFMSCGSKRFTAKDLVLDKPNEQQSLEDYEETLDRFERAFNVDGQSGTSPAHYSRGGGAHHLDDATVSVTSSLTCEMSSVATNSTPPLTPTAPHHAKPCSTNSRHHFASVPGDVGPASPVGPSTPSRTSIDATLSDAQQRSLNAVPSGARRSSMDFLPSQQGSRKLKSCISNGVTTSRSRRTSISVIECSDVPTTSPHQQGLQGSWLDKQHHHVPNDTEAPQAKGKQRFTFDTPPLLPTMSAPVPDPRQVNAPRASMPLSSHADVLRHAQSVDPFATSHRVTTLHAVLGGQDKWTGVPPTGQLKLPSIAMTPTAARGGAASNTITSLFSKVTGLFSRRPSLASSPAPPPHAPTPLHPLGPTSPPAPRKSSNIMTSLTDEPPPPPQMLVKHTKAVSRQAVPTDPRTNSAFSVNTTSVQVLRTAPDLAIGRGVGGGHLNLQAEHRVPMPSVFGDVASVRLPATGRKA